MCWLNNHQLHFPSTTINISWLNLQFCGLDPHFSVNKPHVVPSFFFRHQVNGEVLGEASLPVRGGWGNFTNVSYLWLVPSGKLTVCELENHHAIDG